LKNGQNGGTD
jgi:hypothetical protein